MSLLAPNVGDEVALKRMLNFAAADNCKLRLYTNNHTPAKGDTISNYTECAIAGYSAITLTGASWSIATVATTTTATYATQTFNFTGSGTVYGYYVTDNAGSVVLWAELFTTGPFSVVSGAEIQQPVTITLN